MNWSHVNQRRGHPSDSNRRENPEPLSASNDAQAGYSRDATSMATAGTQPASDSIPILRDGQKAVPAGHC